MNNKQKKNYNNVHDSNKETDMDELFNGVKSFIIPASSLLVRQIQPMPVYNLFCFSSFHNSDSYAVSEFYKPISLILFQDEQ